jgi:hypothetical protein
MTPQEVPGIQELDKHPLHANEYTLHWEPDRFVIDVKTITPQFGPGGQPLQLFIAHKTFSLDPWLAKMLSDQLANAVKGYEKQFGKIEQSKAQLKATKEAAANVTAALPREKPSYMG